MMAHRWLRVGDEIKRERKNLKAVGGGWVLREGEKKQATEAVMLITHPVKKKKEV